MPSACEERGVLEHVVPRHAHAAQRLRAAQAREVAAAQLDTFRRHARERRLAERAAFEEHVAATARRRGRAPRCRQSLKMTRSNFARRAAAKVEAAADEAHVAERRLRQVGAREANRVAAPRAGGSSGSPADSPSRRHARRRPSDRLRAPVLQAPRQDRADRARAAASDTVAEAYGRGHTVAHDADRPPGCDRLDRPPGARGDRGATTEPRARRRDVRLDADRRARAADPGRRRSERACSSARAPDVVLNATLGFAGLPATMWALEHGVTLALANKESLVAAGELALAARERGGGVLHPGRQRALGALPVRAARRAGERRR